MPSPVTVPIPMTSTLSVGGAAATAGARDCAGVVLDRVVVERPTVFARQPACIPVTKNQGEPRVHILDRDFEVAHLPTDLSTRFEDQDYLPPIPQREPALDSIGS